MGWQEKDLFTPDDADALSDEFFRARKDDLSRRVGKRRFRHSEGVSDTAVQLARAYGADVAKARLAGILHDWDKGYSDEEVTQRARDLAVDVDPYVLESMPKVLHGKTAAAALARSYPQIPVDVIQAVSRHTEGACDMTDLDMVVYVADAIEPGRDYPGVQEIRDAVGRASLEELFVMTMREVLSSLVLRSNRVHPASVNVWNRYIERARRASAY